MNIANPPTLSGVLEHSGRFTFPPTTLPWGGIQKIVTIQAHRPRSLYFAVMEGGGKVPFERPRTKCRKKSAIRSTAIRLSLIHI